MPISLHVSENRILWRYSNASVPTQVGKWLCQCGIGHAESRLQGRYAHSRINHISHKEQRRREIKFSWQLIKNSYQSLESYLICRGILLAHTHPFSFPALPRNKLGSNPYLASLLPDSQKPSLSSFYKPYCSLRLAFKSGWVTLRERFHHMEWSSLQENKSKKVPYRKR